MAFQNQKKIFMKKIERFIDKCDMSFFLFGPRGTGKSTWLRETYPDALYIDLLSLDLYRYYSAKPERLVDTIAGNKDRKVVIIDEIQKIPELLSTVHQLIEKDKSKQFIMTGSSSRKLKRAGTDLLSGRAILKKCFPFMASELGKYFSLDKALRTGCLPLICDSEKPKDVLSTYISLYINEEVKQEGLVRNIGAFARFLETISFSHASVLNVLGVAREAEVKRKTAEGYIEILEDLLLAYRLPIFNKRAKRHLISHSKFYYCDSGVFTDLRPSGPLDRIEESGGAALEGLVLQNLLAYIEYSGTHNKIYYWRTKSGNEVDFIIYGDEFLAIEVKYSDKIHTKDLRGLKSFIEDYPEATPILLHRGKARLLLDGVLCIPCDDFLVNLFPNRGIAENMNL